MGSVMLPSLKIDWDRQLTISVGPLGPIRLPSLSDGLGPSNYYLCGPTGFSKITISKGRLKSFRLLSLWTL